MPQLRTQPHLRVPRQQAEEQLRSRVAEGRSLRSRLESGVAYDRVDRDYRQWAAYNRQLIETLFDPPPPEPPPSIRSGVSVARSHADLAAALLDKVEDETSMLEGLLDRLPLYPAADEARGAETTSALAKVERLCDRFPLIVAQLRYRYNDRAPLTITDEYDVQDFIHALLREHFDDIRPEEWTPSHAAKSARMDFLLKSEQIVVETKMTRPGLDAKKLGAELTLDIAHYGKHPNCKTLVCFVYDPDGRIQNPRGLEADLEQQTSQLRVRVLIRPA